MLARRIFTLLPLVCGLTLLSSSPPASAQSEEREEIEDRSDPNQPKVTAGGVYGLATYPLNEVERTLLLPAGTIELRGDIDIDMTENQTFETWTLRLFGRYAIKDTFELQAGLTHLQLIVPEGADRAVGIFAAVEIALAFDFIDFRGAIEIPIAPEAEFDRVLGLPLKYSIGNKLAINALERILTIHTVGRPAPTTEDPNAKETPKPDLTIGVGAVAQILDNLALILRATIILPEFETDESLRRLPVGHDLQYSLSNILDLGLGLRLENAIKKDASEDKIVPFRDRALFVFARFRFGR
jgi:hypothetical protein